MPHSNRRCRVIGSLWCSFAPIPRERPAGYDGRVEHLVSGQVVRFHSLEELLAFMTRVLAEVEQQGEAP